MFATKAALLSDVSCSLDNLVPAEQLDAQHYPSFARGPRRAALFTPPRVVRVGMPAIGPSGESVVIKSISMECGDVWATVRRVDSDSDCAMQLSSLR